VADVWMRASERLRTCDCLCVCGLRVCVDCVRVWIARVCTECVCMDDVCLCERVCGLLACVWIACLWNASVQSVQSVRVRALLPSLLGEALVSLGGGGLHVGLWARPDAAGEREEP
jgi:hypothetical protein